jgi:tetratricopeptide (TPR) repeat protein
MTGDESGTEDLVGRAAGQLARGETLSALALVERAHRAEPTTRSRSYLGLLIALERGQVREGIDLCSGAIEEDPDDTILYLNLGKVLHRDGQKDKAIETVRRGLSRSFHQEASDWLDGLGIRKKPVFPFLSRNNPLNKYVGLVLSKLNLR